MATFSKTLKGIDKEKAGILFMQYIMMDYIVRYNPKTKIMTIVLKDLEL